jgi:hypothetical protein
MEVLDQKKEVAKEFKKYVSLSTRLPRSDASDYQTFCDRLKTNTSERLRQLIIADLQKPLKQTLSGVNKIKYNKVHNSFNWSIQLDSGQENEVLNNLSLEFLKNFQNEIQEAIKERNEWVHQVKSTSVDIPGELVGRKE